MVSVHKALEMQARVTTKRAQTGAGRATQAHDNDLDGEEAPGAPLVQEAHVAGCE